MRLCLFLCVYSSAVFGHTLSPITVSAKKIEPLTFSKESLDYPDIENAHPQTLQDVLKTIPGVQFVSYGGVGALSNLSVQGGNINHTLILMDGVSAEDPATPEGAVNMGTFTADAFDKLSLQKGPLSSIYGAGGLNGVISLESEKGHDTPTHKLSTGVGSHGMTLVKGMSQGSLNRFHYNVRISNLSTQGDHIKPLALRTVSRDDLRDKAHLFNVRGRFDGDVNDDTRITWISRYEDVHNHYNNYYPSTNPFKVGYTRAQQQVFKITKDIITGGFYGAHDFTYATSSRTRIDREDVAPFLKKDLNEGSADQLAYHVGVEKERVSFLGGADYRREKMSVHQAIAQESLILKKTGYRHSVFMAPGITKEWGHNRATLKSAIRLDHAIGFGDHVSYALGGIYESPQATQYKASYGTGFKAPTLYQRFVNTPFAKGNPLLKPETSKGIQIAVEQPFLRGINAQVMYFKNNVSQLIQTLPNTQGVSEYGNTGRATFQGFEEKLTWQYGFIRTSVAHTYTHTHNHATRRSVIRRPKNGFYVDCSYEDKDALTAGVIVRYLSKPYDVDPKTFLVVDGKRNTSVDLYANYKVTRNAEVFGRIDNTFNAKNEMPLGYSQPGMTALLGVTVSL